MPQIRLVKPIFVPAMHLEKIGNPNMSGWLSHEQAATPWSPLKLAPYRREYARALVLRRKYKGAAQQLRLMAQAASSLPGAPTPTQHTAHFPFYFTSV